MPRLQLLDPGPCVLDSDKQILVPTPYDRVAFENLEMRLIGTWQASSDSKDSSVHTGCLVFFSVALWT